ncbi:T9SS type A sorting domain-containing protein [Roseimarinus sediminis]|uniref:T9SS type A sorting domain-containing protein n=1 Tax=Roseimarinus sediminis TaxID=1610899 RepID=UPI003D241536
MKNYLTYGIYGILAIIIIMTGIHQSKKSDLPDQPAKFKTTAKMKAASISKKFQRRASGWSKPDKPSEFLHFHQLIRTPDEAGTVSYPMNYRMDALKSALEQKAHLKSASINGEWTERGPGNVSGRTRGLIIDPDDPTGNTWFAGSVGGGIWKTSDAGESWKNLTPSLPSLSTVCLAMAPSNTSLIYAGTGEGFGNSDAIKGDGIFKSEDKGASWTQLQSTAANEDFAFVNRIIVDPNNEQVLIAATNTSIQRSSDGGQTWTRVFEDDGRVQHLIHHPGSFDIQYASINNKGIVRSSDGGQTWNYVLQHGYGRIEMAISPSDPSTIYALDQTSQMLITEDGGNSWSPASVTLGSREILLGGQGWYNNTLSVDPSNPKTLLVGGVNLFRVSVSKESSTPVSTYRVDTLNTSGFISFVNFGASHFGGAFDINTEKENYETLAIQFGPGKKQKAHRFLVPQGATSGVPDNSHSYSNYIDVPFEVWDTGNKRQLMVSFRDQDRNGEFNLTLHDDAAVTGREYIWIHDVDYSETASPNIAKTGGHLYEEMAFTWPVLAQGATWLPNELPDANIVINRSTSFPKELTSNKIADWAGMGAPYVHADLHNIIHTTNASSDTRIVVANDGGLAYSDNNGVSWENPANGYNTTQFYGVDKHPYEDRYIGGMQDNGSWFSGLNPDSTAQWTEATGGDGFDAVWHATDANKMITSLYYNMLYLSPDGGETWGSISSQLTDSGEENAPFITQIGYSPADPDKIFLTGKSGVSRSLDFGQNWETIELPASDWGWGGYAVIEISAANPDIVWAASRMSDQGKIHVSTDGGSTFNTVNNYSVSMGMLSGLATHPHDSGVAYALFSFAGKAKILKTEDMGNSWTDLSQFENGESMNNFPDVAVFSLLVMPHNDQILWAGTEIGLFVSEDGGASWSYANNGLPATAIWELKIRGTQIIAATHGRGIYSIEIPELALAVQAPALLAAGTSPQNLTALKFQLSQGYDSLQLIIDGKQSIKMQQAYNTDTLATGFFNLQLPEGKYKLQLQAYHQGHVLSSASRTLDLLTMNEAQSTYSNVFNTSSNDFYGEGFSIKAWNSLGEGMALHSEHPYPDKSNQSIVLRTPIILQQKSEQEATTLSYFDIPMVEEGETGAPFGSSDFYDYVVVEGSKNGVDWLPLFDGYDYRAVKFKAEIRGMNINSDPVETLFIEHKVNMLRHFEHNDTLLIRFRLFSDLNTNGWGWVIDDIEINHSDISSTKATADSEFRFYPIPCNDVLNIVTQNAGNSSVKISVYNQQGRMVLQREALQAKHVRLNTQNLEQGSYLLEIETADGVQRKKFMVRR